jgi:hypothetical protein
MRRVQVNAQNFVRLDPAGICAHNVPTVGICASQLKGLSGMLEFLLTPLLLQMLRIFSSIKSGRNSGNILICFWIFIDQKVTSWLPPLLSSYQSHQRLDFVSIVSIMDHVGDYVGSTTVAQQRDICSLQWIADLGRCPCHAELDGKAGSVSPSP